MFTSSQYHLKFISSNSTSSIYQEIVSNTTQRTSPVSSLFAEPRQVTTRKAQSLLLVPANGNMLSGYFSTHYKYKKMVFSQKEINSIENFYDQNGRPQLRSSKWKRNSQNKKTTVDPLTGNLNNTEPVERKTA